MNALRDLVRKTEKGGKDMFMRKKREGFTLVELLIVMAVIAALMGALVPVALSAIQHANATRIAENLQSLVTQVQQYAYSNHTLPTISALSTSVSGGNISDYEIGTYSGGAVTPSNNQTLTASKTIFAVVYLPSFNAAAVHNVWNGTTTIGASVAATSVVVRYW